MSDSNTTIDNINTLFIKAQNTHNQFIHALEQAIDGLNGQDSFVLLHGHQLTLQLRLDTQEILKQLLVFNQGYCQAIGIEPQHSNVVNMENLIVSLGKGNLKNSMALIIGIVNQLRKTIAISEETLIEQEKEYKKLRKLLAKLGKINDTLPSSKRASMRFIADDNGNIPIQGLTRHPPSVSSQLQNALGLQTQLANCIEILTESINVVAGSPKMGVVYDYLVALKGPISRFFQAVANGVGTMETLNKWSLLKLNIKQPEVALTQLQTQLTKQLTQINQRQQQLAHQTKQQTTLLSTMTTELNKTLSTPIKAPNTDNRLQGASTAHRMMDLFNRK